MNLEDAIRSRRLVSFTYDQLPRVVEPATLGYTSTGKLSLRGCLIEGESRRNTLPCWELYTVDKIESLVSTSDTFVDFSLDGYTRGDSAFVQILAEH